MITAFMLWMLLLVARIWSFGTGSYVTSSPAVVNGVVYIGSEDNNVYALDAGSGSKIWSYSASSAVDSSPAVANGVVYVGSEDSNLYALNASSGGTVWTYGTGYTIESSPAIANGVVYVGSDDQNVYAFGSITVPQPSPVVPSPSVPEFPSQIFGFLLIVSTGCVAIAVITAKKKR